MFQDNLNPPFVFFTQLGSMFAGDVFRLWACGLGRRKRVPGYLQPLLADKMNLWAAIWVHATLFSAAHLDYTSHLLDFGTLFVTGLILGWLRWQSSGIIAPFIAHGLFWLMGAFMVLPA